MSSWVASSPANALDIPPRPPPMLAFLAVDVRWNLLAVPYTRRQLLAASGVDDLTRIQHRSQRRGVHPRH